MPSPPWLSIIIPTLNEAGHIGPTLRALPYTDPSIEILIVDGGSTDDTLQEASFYAETLSAPRGRAAQMNAGAQRATADVLLFLHADTLLPEQSLANMKQALQASNIVAGTFRLRFDHLHPLLNFYSWCTTIPWSGLAFGDRGLFVRRKAFETINGYPAWPMFEDLEIVKQLRTVGPFMFLPAHVVTSARRFQQNGLLRQQLRNLLLWLGYQIGAKPERLTQFYPYPEDAASETTNVA